MIPLTQKKNHHYERHVHDYSRKYKLICQDKMAKLNA